MDSTTGSAAPRIVPRSKQNPNTGQRSSIARGRSGSAVSASAPWFAAAPRTTWSGPICQVIPAVCAADHTTVPQAAMSPDSARTCGAAGVQVSEVSAGPPAVPGTCSAAQVTRAPESPCAHSAEMSKYRLTRCAAPSVPRTCAVT